MYAILFQPNEERYEWRKKKRFIILITASGILKMKNETVQKIMQSIYQEVLYTYKKM